MEKSTQKAEVIKIFLEKHPNADSLSIIRVFNYVVVVRTADFQNCKLGVYFPPETLLPVENTSFAFLADKAKGGFARIKAKKIRGIQSYGLLIPAPDNANEGDNLYEYYGCKHFDAELDDSVCDGKMNTDNEKAPSISCLPGKYDVDTLRRYKDCFVDDETVLCMEKVHGSNALYTYHNERMYAKSRNFWKKPNPDNEQCIWWLALQNSNGIEQFCKDNPGWFVYGEVVGKVKGFDYAANGKPYVLAFDIMRPDGRYVDSREFLSLCEKYGIKTAPVIGFIPFDFNYLESINECNTRVDGAKHIAEGLCIRPEVERWNPEIGRVHLKLVSAQYLEKINIMLPYFCTRCGENKVAKISMCEECKEYIKNYDLWFNNLKCHCGKPAIGFCMGGTFCSDEHYPNYQKGKN